FRRAKPVHAGVAATILIVIVLAALLLGARHDRRIADFDSLSSQAGARLTAGDRAGAVELFRKALAALPDAERSANAWNDRGGAPRQSGQHEEARGAFRKALLLRPVSPLARNTLEVTQRELDIKKSEKARSGTRSGS